MCCVYKRGVDSFKVTEEYLDLIPLKGTVIGQDVFEALESASNVQDCTGRNCMVSVATDGAPAMYPQTISGSAQIKS